jgi:hypothetical protein
MRSKFEGKTPDEMMEILEHGNTNERAAALALQYGMIDGAHHKQWLIDQMLRIICGAGYEEIIAIYNSEEDYSDWDIGIAP